MNENVIFEDSKGTYCVPSNIVGELNEVIAKHKMDHKYVKIKRLGERSNINIYDGTVEETEKIDGANFSYYLDNDELVFRSHNRIIPTEDYEDKAWKVCIEYIKGVHEVIPFEEWLIYFGECMTKHTLNYGITPPFIGYAVYDPRNQRYYGNWKYHFVSRDIPTPEITIHIDTKLLTDEYIESRMRLPSQFGTSGVVREGIVLKNYGNQQFAKFVNDDFKEQNKALFGAGEEKHSDTWKIVDKYCTPARIDKSIFTIRDEHGMAMGMEMMRMLPAFVDSDILSEEILNIRKKCKQINFKEYKKLIAPKCVEQLEHRIKEEMA